MLTDLLTRDNPLLSRPTMAGPEPLSIAGTCTNMLTEAVIGFVANSISPNTQRAYECDLAHFEARLAVIADRPIPIQ